MQLIDIKELIKLEYWNVLKEIKKRKDATKTQVAKGADVSYVHCFQILKKLKKIKLITVEKIGRKCILKITKRGKSLCEVIDKIWDIK